MHKRLFSSLFFISLLLPIFAFAQDNRELDE